MKSRGQEMLPFTTGRQETRNMCGGLEGYLLKHYGLVVNRLVLHSCLVEESTLKTKAKFSIE